MNPLWFIMGATLVAALVAWRQARRTARRLEQLTQMYWELKYQHGELRVQLRQLTGASPAAGPGPSATPGTGESAPPPAPPAEAFVPLSAVKR